MVDQPVVRAAPLIFGNGLHELMLGLEHIRRVRQPQPIGDAENMRIDGDGILAERAAHDDVRRLASHTRQGFQSVMIRGHFAAEAGDQLPRHQHKVFGLVVEQAAGLDIRFDLFRFGLGQSRRVGIGREKRGRNHVDFHIRTLSGENHGDEQLKRIGKVQRGFRVWIQPRQLGENQAVFLFSFHH